MAWVVVSVQKEKPLCANPVVAVRAGLDGNCLPAGRSADETLS